MKYETSQRNNAMEIIARMNNDTFLWKLLSNRLPDFVRATNVDHDYIPILRDSNHIGVEYILYHRQQLRQCSRELFLEYLFLEENDVEKKQKKIRDLVMYLIDKKSSIDFLVALRDMDVPTFTRAIPGDDDYFEVNYEDISKCVSKEEFYLVHKNILRVIEWDTFIQMGTILTSCI